MLTKFRQLIEAVIELPNAALACVEMAREAEYTRGQREIGNSSQARKERVEWNEIVNKQSARVHDLTYKLAESERKLASEVEARRWRRLDANDNVDGLTPVVFRQQTGSASRDFRTTLRMHLTEPSLTGCEWRYLSPEDMP